MLREEHGLAPAESLREALQDEVFTALEAAGAETGYRQQVRVT
ncbi:hypothetical protein PWG71_21130 [Nocardiopsis sp. N85]|nr:hypothetical protein [Nocardiopsis sp. N85]MDE3723902.1 hypothetical protein [Nocardiopsis sp. N85]